MNETLDKLIEKYKKNSKLSQTDGVTYVEELKKVLQLGEYTDNLDRYLCDGHTDLSMKALADYVTVTDEQQAKNILNKFIKSSRMKENLAGGPVIRLCNLLKYLREASPEKVWAEQKVFLYIVWYSYKSDASINVVALKTIRKILFPMFSDKNPNLKLNFINKPDTWRKTKTLFMTAALDDEHPDRKICSLVYKWLESSGQLMEPYTEERITQRIEKAEKVIEEKNQKEKETAEKSAMQAAKSPAESRVIISPDKSHEVTSAQPDQKAPENEIKEEEKDPLVLLRRILETQVMMTSSLSARVRLLEEARTLDSELIKKLRDELHMQQDRYNQLFDEKKHLDEENEVLASQLDSASTMIDQLQSDYKNSSQFSDTVISGLRKDQMAFLNKLASELRVDYADFRDAKDEEMTAELGENMRVQLEEVFGILERNGINVKG
jgi:hypothetical protein